MKASVALLTKNGGELLKECVRAVRAQRFEPGFEFLAIDSESRDGSAEFLRAQQGIRFISIPASQFQHGRTRNEAMRRARGELVAFLTQDAVPVDVDWLAEMVAFMEARPGVAGAFGRQIPHGGADPLEAWEVCCHFDSFRGEVEFRRPADGSLPADEAQQARLHYFSNVNSCIRRSAWERIPFPEIDFGEDQAWARAVQAAGMATGYAERAVVRHSHDYGPLTLFRRRYDEARFMKREFGYALMPSWAQARQTAMAHAQAFHQHLASLPGGPMPASWARAAARAWAAALGRWAGTRLSGDGALHAWLSLDERRRRT